MIDKTISDLLVLLTTIDPIGTLVLYGVVSRSIPIERRPAVVRKAVIYAGAILLSAIVFGQFILSGLGIKLISFELAGGIILFIFGLKMVFGKIANLAGDKPEPGHDVAVFPLAVPSLASPGAIVAAILLTDNRNFSIHQQILTGVLTLSVLLIAYLLMRFADPILRTMGKNGAAILERLLGMLLCAMSVEFIMKALGVARWSVS